MITKQRFYFSLVFLLSVLASCSKSTGGTNLLDQIKDDAFKKYCLWSMDINEDGVLSEEEVQPITCIMLSGKEKITEGGVKTVEGIEIFKRLTDDFITNNPELKTIDLSKNTRLVQAFLWNNSGLKNVNFSGCVALERVEIDGSLIEVIDLSNSPELEFFQFPDCTALREIIISSVQEQRRHTPHPNAPENMILQFVTNMDMSKIKITVK